MLRDIADRFWTHVYANRYPRWVRDVADRLDSHFNPPYSVKDDPDVTPVPSRWFRGKPYDWIYLRNVHERNEICDIACVIHNPADHHMQEWPLHWRDDRGIFERICEHGVGHPDPSQFPYWDKMRESWRPSIADDDGPYPKSNPYDGIGVHGCCGCCRPPKESKV